MAFHYYMAQWVSLGNNIAFAQRERRPRSGTLQETQSASDWFTGMPMTANISAPVRGRLCFLLHLWCFLAPTHKENKMEQPSHPNKNTQHIKKGIGSDKAAGVHCWLWTWANSHQACWFFPSSLSGQGFVTSPWIAHVEVKNSHESLVWKQNTIEMILNLPSLPNQAISKVVFIQWLEPCCWITEPVNKQIRLATLLYLDF